MTATGQPDSETAGQLGNWAADQSGSQTVWGPCLASRSFVHPFVAVSNKNYDRLSHMLSLRRGPEAAPASAL